MSDGPRQPPQYYPQWAYDEPQAAQPPIPIQPAPGSLPRPSYRLPSNYPPQPEEQSPALSPASSYDPGLAMNMGSSLGYSQTMEFQAISVSQPSQSFAPVRRRREARLRELRKERLNRQQGQEPINGSMPGQLRGQRVPESRAVFPASRPSAPIPGPGNAFSPNAQAPASIFPSQPVAVSAAAPAQDTGMIQRDKVQRAAFLITGAFMFSSILGLVRTFLFSYIFGASTFSDAYLQAYIIPNLLYTVVAGGALSSAFIPVFTKYADGLNDEKTAWHIASSALNLAVIIMVALSGIAMIFAPVIVPLYSPGFSAPEVALITTLTRIMLLQAIVLGSGVIVSSVLNAKQDFTLTAAGTVLYNVGQIIGLLPGIFLGLHARGSNPGDLAIYSATWGVVLAAVLQIGVQIPGLFKVKMRYTFSFDWRNSGVREIGRQMVPRTINAAMLSFSTAVDRFLLSFLSTVASTLVVNGLITEYFNAFTILLLPVSLFGSSVSTAAFPALASYVARQRFDRVRSIIMENLRSILFLSIPSSVGLIMLALPIVQVLLEHGRFTLQNAQFTTIPLIAFAAGLPGLAAVEILTRAFYALHDTKTPVIISVLQFILKILLSIILIDVSVFGIQWGMGAMAFSTSVASALEAVALYILLARRIEGFDLRGLYDFIGRCFLAALAMGAALFIVRTILDGVIDTTSMNTLALGGILLAMIKLMIELGVGSVAFLVVARLLKIEELNSGPVRRILNRLHVPWL